MILDFTRFNVLAVLACGLASLAIGFVWYGPLFGKAWAAYTGWTDEKVKAVPGSKMATRYGLTFLLALFTASALSGFSSALGLTSYGQGLWLGLVAGIAFTAAGFATTYLFEGKPFGLWLIVSGYEVVFTAAAGTIVTVWR